MADQDLNFPITDPVEFSKNMAKVADRSQRILSEVMKRPTDGAATPTPDPVSIGNAFMEATARSLAEPAKLLEAQIGLWQNSLSVWQSIGARSLGQEASSPIKPEPSDRRFRDPAWDAYPIFDFVKQSYLLAARSLQQSVRNISGLDEQTARKVDFYTRQFIDAMAPTNFILTNPEVLRATLDSNGENLVRGLDNMLADLERGKGEFMVRQTDLDAFEVGRNVAVTPGKVVYQNELMQLIQYNATTEQVYSRPLLIVPPWINKYYILDLRPDNSFVRWAVDQGYTVFVISWVNPDERLAHKDFTDYMFEGPLAALGAIERATGERDVNVVGYCIGGTLMAATLAYNAVREDERVTSCTLLAAQVDFSEAGELSVFIDEEQIQQIEKRMQRHGGVLDAATMATTFNLLRANDLIWSFVVSNYLLGREPLPFDLLFWNSDATRLPAKMHTYYLRNMYQRNLLVQPGALEIDRVPIDIRRVRTPIYLQATREDHIAPFRSVFKAMHHFAGPVRFVLAASGHIAGVVNHPAANKYQHWTKDAQTPGATPEEWLRDATAHPGSWWPDWHQWLSQRSGSQIQARVPGDGKLVPIEDAPGSYVRVRS